MRHDALRWLRGEQVANARWAGTQQGSSTSGGTRAIEHFTSAHVVVGHNGLGGLALRVDRDLIKALRHAQVAPGA